MGNIISSFDNYQISNTGLNQEQIQSTLNRSTQAVTDSFENNTAGKMVSGNTDNPDIMKNTLMLLPALSAADKLIDKAIGGAGGDGLLGKTASLGDKISGALHLDNIFSSETGSKVSSFVKNNRFLKYFTNDYKAIPKSSMAKSQTMVQKYSQEVVDALAKLKYDYGYSDLFGKSAQALKPETFKTLEQVGGPLKGGISVDYLKSVQKALKEISTRAVDDDVKIISELDDKISKFIADAAEGKETSSTSSLADDIASVLSIFKGNKYQSLRVPAANPLSSESLKVLNSVSGKNAAETINPEKLIDAVDDIISKTGKDTVKKDGITSGSINLSTLKNKLKASNLQMGKTGIGQTLAKGTLKTKDIITYGGGLISLGFAANAIVQAVKATKEAPKGEKKSTFMHVLSENYIGIILFQPSINLLYKAGGNKYRGMDVEARNAYKEFVTKTNADKTLTKAGYKVAKLQENLLLKGVSKDKVAELTGKGVNEAKKLAKSLKKEGTKLKFWEKPLKAAGKILDTGLDSLKSPSKLGKAAGKLKGFAGGFGRFALILFVIQPIIQKPVTKLIHKIFGEPKTYLAKQEAANSSESTVTQTPASNHKPAANYDNQETNLIKKWTQPAVSEQPMEQVPSTQTALNSDTSEISASSLANLASTDIDANSNNKIAAAKISKENGGRYIPSIEPTQFEDNEKEIQAQINEILKSTDSIVENTKKYL